MRGGREGPLARLIIDNPAKRNALDLAMWEFAADLLAELAEDTGVRLLEVSGAGGKSFAAGADISRFAAERSTPQAVAHYAAVTSAVYDRLARFPRPTVARIEGACIGGGLALATCCDIRIAADGARFGVPAGRLGLSYGIDAQRRLSDLVGPVAAAELLFTARRIGTEEALRLGLVQHVAPAPDFARFADDYVAQILANAPLTMAAIKAIRVALADGRLEDERPALNARVAACFASEDYAEGRTAFAEKRAPVFRGQ
jgi:enoyl-CoA hydratase/carnithine racemase